MQSSNEATLQMLNALVRVSKDAEQGYQTAALDVADDNLARLFADFAAQRMKFVVELQQRVKLLRGDPPKEGTPGGALHRAWMDLDAALESGSPYAVLSECVQGEEVALIEYREALKMTDLDEDSRRMVQRQYEAVQAAHDRIRQLRDNPVYAQR
jgi:uncharacterized protein (TIGR02284 family)